MVIVSLSTIPPRFKMIGPALESLLAQSATIDRILLYIPTEYRRFPEYDGSLPDVPDGVEVRRAHKDYGPATKIFCAAQDFADQDCTILFCDDDRIYARDWAQTLLDAQSQQPEACIAIRGREANTLFDSKQIRDHQPRAVKREWQQDYWYMFKYALWKLNKRLSRKSKMPLRKTFKTAGFIDIFMGFGGVLVKPSFFEPEDFEIPDACWSVDDIWISGMLARKGIPIWVPANTYQPANTDAFLVEPLFAATIKQVNRDSAEDMTYDYLRKTYGIWP